MKNGKMELDDLAAVAGALIVSEQIVFRKEILKQLQDDLIRLNLENIENQRELVSLRARLKAEMNAHEALIAQLAKTS